MDERASSPEVLPQERASIEEIFRPSKVLDQVVRKMVKKPQLLDNFKRIFYKTPKLPPALSQEKPRIPPPAPKQDHPKPKKKVIIIDDDRSFIPIKDSSLPKYQKPDVKPILTPKWGTGFVAPTLPEEKEKNENQNKGPDFIKLHQPIEIMESRIFMCKDSEHYHTGQILKIASKDPPKNITEQENKRLDNYFKTEPMKKIPCQWEPRVWDKPENTLSQVESDELYAKIKQNRIDSLNPDNWNLDGRHRRKHRTSSKPTLNKKESKPYQHVLRQTHRSHSYADSDDDVDDRDFVPRSQSQTTTTRKRPGRHRKTVVTLSTICYFTDDSDELTDWDDFEF